MDVVDRLRYRCRVVRLRALLVHMTEEDWDEENPLDKMEFVGKIIRAEQAAFIRFHFYDRENVARLDAMYQSDLQAIETFAKKFDPNHSGGVRMLRNKLCTPSWMVNDRLEEYWISLRARSASMNRDDLSKIIQAFGRLYISRSPEMAFRCFRREVRNHPLLKHCQKHQVTTRQQLRIALTHLKLVSDQSQLQSLEADLKRRPQPSPTGPPPPYEMHYFDSRERSTDDQLPSYAFRLPTSSEWIGASNLIAVDDARYVREAADILGFEEGSCVSFSARPRIRSRQLTRFITDLYLCSGFAVILDGGDIVGLSAKAEMTYVIYVKPDSGKASYTAVENGPYEMKSILEKMLPDLRGRGVHLHFPTILTEDVPLNRSDEEIENYGLIPAVFGCLLSVLSRN